jgi:hypothetical protein
MVRSVDSEFRCPMRRRLIPLILILLLIGVACGPRSVEVADGPATATLAPVVSQTPRLTATPEPTRTPIPTFTPVPPTETVSPTPSDTPTPTEIPPVIGVVNSLQSVNVRSGPGIDFPEFEALSPNSEIEIIGQSSDGQWLNVRLNNGDEGWMAARLILLRPTPTPFPTFTATVDQTAIAQGTEFPTAVIGGGSVTPTPVNPAISPTPVVPVTSDPDAVTPTPRILASATSRNAGIDSTPVLNTFTPTPSVTPTSALFVDESVLPVIDLDAINATATALSRNVGPPTPSPTPDRETNIIVTPDNASIFAPRTETPAANDDEDGEDTDVGDSDSDNDLSNIAADGEAIQSEAARVQQAVDVLAYCDDPSFNAPAPDNLAGGSTIDIFWVWYAATEAYVDDHLSSAEYEIAINGVPLRNVNQYRLPVQESGTDFVVYWYAPAGPLTPGEYEITYRVTWSRQIFDGYEFYGPGTNFAVEEGSCTFTVYEGGVG